MHQWEMKGAKTFQRLLRAIKVAMRCLESELLKCWYRCQFADVTIGRQVTLHRSVVINVVKGGSLNIGDGCSIEENVRLIAHGKLLIGKRAFIGAGCNFVSINHISIGDDALIAAYATILDHNHRTQRGDVPFNAQGLVSAPVYLGNNVWLGTKATILPGVTMGHNSIAGANAVVTKAVEDDMTVVGIPARPLQK